MKKMIIAGLVTGFLLVLTAQFIMAAQLLSEEKALKEMLPGADRVEKVNHTLTAAEYERISGRLGGMVLLQKGSKTKEAAEKRDYTFYFGYKGDKKTGVAVFEEQAGKWGPVGFVVALDPETAKVKDLAVTNLEEKRGKPIARRNFLDRFLGKGSADPIEIRDDIKSITGATISCKCAAFVVRKVIALYEEVYLSNSTARPVAKKVVKPLLERLQECDRETRTKAYEEFCKLDQVKKDKITQQLMDILNKKETTKCQLEGINFVLRSNAHSKVLEKLQGTKTPSEIKLGNSFESALGKLAELGKINVVWADKSLQDAAKKVKLDDAFELDGEDNIHAALENIFECCGCDVNRGIEDDKLPCYTYVVEADGIKVTDITTTPKYWQDWWTSQKGNGVK